MENLKFIPVIIVCIMMVVSPLSANEKLLLLEAEYARHANQIQESTHKLAEAEQKLCRHKIENLELPSTEKSRLLEKCGKKTPLGTYKITTYYAPEPGQGQYFTGSYLSDKGINCSGSCLHTANGTVLSDEHWGKYLACPSILKHGTHLYVEGVGVAECVDRGGSIKGQRLDLWVGVGEAGYNRIGYGSGQKTVYVVE